MGIPTYSATTAVDTIANALNEAGCVVVTGVFDESARTRVTKELAPYMDRVPVEEDDPRHATTFYMQSLALDETAKFVLLDVIELETGIQQLADIGGRLVGQDNQRTLQLFDTANPASLSVAGQGELDGCLWFNLGGVTGDIESGLWLPLGNYGAVKIDWEE